MNTRGGVSDQFGFLSDGVSADSVIKYATVGVVEAEEVKDETETTGDEAVEGMRNRVIVGKIVLPAEY